MIDWDEANAFNNVPRDGVASLPLGPCSPFAAWALAHYRRFRIRVATHFGVSAPFPMMHGGAQGDSGGVGLFTLISAVRTWAHQFIWGNRLDPQHLSTLPEPPQLCHHPADASVPLCEIVYSDDRRLFAASAQGAEPDWLSRCPRITVMWSTPLPPPVCLPPPEQGTPHRYTTSRR